MCGGAGISRYAISRKCQSTYLPFGATKPHTNDICKKGKVPSNCVMRMRIVALLFPCTYTPRLPVHIARSTCPERYKISGSRLSASKSQYLPEDGTIHSCNVILLRTFLSRRYIVLSGHVYRTKILQTQELTL